MARYNRLFVLHDKEPLAPVEIRSKEEAKQYNERGYGVFHVVNWFEGARRVENLKGIRYWFADLDTGTKEEQLARVAAQPIKPSRVVETQKGHHVYYRAVDATLTNWHRIVKWGLLPALGADQRASDPLRLLRVPGFYHNKGEPFLVRTVVMNNRDYTEPQMLEAFPDQRAEVEDSVVRRESKEGSFWAQVAQLPAREFIKRVSGHEIVQGELFKLQPTSGGKANVLVRKPGQSRWKSTPCWVTDADTLAGVEGGASPAAFLKWYESNTWKDIARELAAMFPKELHASEEK